MLITFEGLDGCGKSTQARLLLERLESAGYPAVLLREPGGTIVSERIRTLLLDPSLHMVPFAELLLFSAARTQLVQERIRPLLEQGYVVICDRFYDSTTAYQSGGRQLQDAAWVQAFNMRVTGGLSPARTYLLEIDPCTAQARRSDRPVDAAAPIEDRIEASGEGFYARVAAAYDRLAAAEPLRILRLDGTEPIEVLQGLIWEDINRRLGVAGTPLSGEGSSE